MLSTIKPYTPYAALLLLCCCLGSCKSLAQRNKEKGIVKSSERIVCNTSDTYPVDIYSTYNINLKENKTPNSPKLPKSYTIYKIDNKQLRLFFKKVKERGSGSIFLPVAELGCKKFSLSNADVMSAALAEKFPNIVSLKGFNDAENTNTIRLDYDGKTMKAVITWDNEVYYITPWQTEDAIYYLFYNRKDSGYPKVPFE